ncbi:lipase 1-like [Phlebotomus argentipes]|uniref:lipase 1-like n=1 Tax=Phlebotomus argentipes TaxID=94469 RepID=UPI002893429E|nr:lipase 1-like [Phlebotomus argentipes]
MSAFYLVALDIHAQFLEPLNYTVDDFDIVTKDGYILQLYHVRNESRAQGGPVVYLQHGLLSSCADFCVTGQKSLVAILMESNYDVWMGNNRGSFYSTRHTNLSVTDRSYWKFSWHEIGIYDIPAFINFILDYTKQPSLHYIGHSQGSTVFFVMMSSFPEFNDKVRSMQALAPAVFMSHVKNPLVRSLAKFVNVMTFTWRTLQLDEVIAGDNLFNRIVKVICQSNDFSKDICSNILCALGGCNIETISEPVVPLVLKLSPAPASVYQVFHFAQEINSGRFCEYDFGPKKNLQRYASIKPPSYNLDNVKIPVTLYTGVSDLFVNIRDVEKLGSYLAKLEDIIEVPDKKFGHMDFCWGEEARDLVYASILQVIEKHSANQSEKKNISSKAVEYAEA